MAAVPLEVILLCLVSLIMATGQLMFRAGARGAASVQDLSSLIGLILSPTIVAAIGLYGVATVLYVWALQRVELSVAYPFMAASIILVPLGAAVFFGEHLGLKYFLGLGLILAGVYLTAVK